MAKIPDELLMKKNKVSKKKSIPEKDFSHVFVWQMEKSQY